VYPVAFSTTATTVPVSWASVGDDVLVTVPTRQPLTVVTFEKGSQVDPFSHDNELPDPGLQIVMVKDVKFEPLATWAS